MRAYLHVMGNLAQIVEFCAGVNERFVKSTSVDTAIRTNFYVGFDSDSSDLRNLEMAFAVEDETEPVGTDDDASMKNHAISEL